MKNSTRWFELPSEPAITVASSVNCLLRDELCLADWVAASLVARVGHLHMAQGHEPRQHWLSASAAVFHLPGRRYKSTGTSLLLSIFGCPETQRSHSPGLPTVAVSRVGEPIGAR